MSDLVHWFYTGGPVMWPLLVLAVFAAVCALAAARAARVSDHDAAWRLTRLCGIFGLLAGVGGFAGWRFDQRHIEASLRFFDPSMRDALMEVGMAEARVPLYFGGGVGVVALLAAAGLYGASRRTEGSVPPQ